MKEALLDAHVKLVKKNAITIAALKARIKELEASNRRLHEALGKKGAEHHLHINEEYIDGLWYPNYKADPRLVIEAMMERKDWPLFLDYVGGDYYPPADPLAGNISLIDCNLILDKTGKLRDAAIEWLEVKG